MPDHKRSKSLAGRYACARCHGTGKQDALAGKELVRETAGRYMRCSKKMRCYACGGRGWLPRAGGDTQ